MSCVPAFRYNAAVFRFAESLKALWFSVVFYFCQFFDKEVEVTVTALPDVRVLKYLPWDLDEFFRKLRDMWELVFDVNVFMSFIGNLLMKIDDISMLILLLLPLVLLLPILFTKIILNLNNNHGEKSKLVIFFEDKVIDTFSLLKNCISEIFEYFWSRKYFKISFIVIWLLNFNVLTVCAEFLAWYFYFCFSFDVLNIFIQVFKLLLDLVIFFSSADVVFWLVASYAVVCYIRNEIGYKRLNFRESLDRAFLDRQPLIIMFTGTMGTGKTTALTGALLSYEIKFRNKALELMLELDAKYPNFPWINLEDDLRAAIEVGVVKNLTTCRDFIDIRKKIFCETNNRGDIFDYDIERYRYFVDDNLTYKEIWDTISDYACLYFIYIIESSLIVSNYSVRSDNLFVDNGNFPLWDMELFRNDPRASEARSRRSHVLDYDVLRLGDKVLKDNPRSNSFEFGVVGFSEFAKERGNQLTLQELKKSDNKANQKNDLLGYSLKMCRHKATICGFPFVVFVADEQRPESLSADVRDLLSIIHIESKEPKELLMPMYFVEELLHDLLYPHWIEFYVEYRLNRGDICFPVYLIHNVMSFFHLEYMKKYNLFGCNVLNVTTQSGKMDGEVKRDKLHILYKKVYSGRFATDCHYGFFVPGLRETRSSFDEYMEYSDTVASIEELEYQNSYFIADMQKINVKGKNDEV